MYVCSSLVVVVLVVSVVTPVPNVSRLSSTLLRWFQIPSSNIQPGIKLSVLQILPVRTNSCACAGSWNQAGKEGRRRNGGGTKISNISNNQLGVCLYRYVSRERSIRWVLHWWWCVEGKSWESELKKNARHLCLHKICTLSVVVISLRKKVHLLNINTRPTKHIEQALSQRNRSTTQRRAAE